MSMKFIPGKIIRHFLFLSHRYFLRLSREITIISPALIIFLIALNLNFPKSSFEKLKENVQINPADFASHLLLAGQFISVNQYSLAQKEIGQPRGKNVEKIKEIEELIHHPAKVKQEIFFWKNSLNQYPSHRDAHIKLAILNWKLYRNFDATKNLLLAKSLDPNNSSLNQFELYLK